MNNLRVLRDSLLYSANSSYAESEGVSPLSFKGKEGVLKNYQIYGNSIQEQNGGTNIIKTNSVTLSGTEVDVSVTGDFALSTTEKYYFAFTTVGCTYIDDTLALFEVTYSDGTVISIPPTESYKILNEDGKTLTGIKCVNKCGCTGTVKNISCYTGRKPYEDNYSEISSVGDLNSDTGKYEIPVMVRGKNLFSISRDVNYINSSSVSKGTDYFIGIRLSSVEDVHPGSYNWSSGRVGFQNVTYGTATAANRFVKDLKPNTTYTFSCDVEVLEFAEGVTSINPKCTMAVSGKSVDSYAGNVTELNAKKNIKNTFVTGNEIGTVTFTLYLQSCKLKFSNPQLEEGSAETDFEEYKEPINYTIQLDEPLRSVDGKTDYIDFKTKKVIRNVYEMTVRKTNVVDKNKTFEKEYGWNAFEVTLPTTYYFVNLYTTWGLSTHFINSVNQTSNGLTKPYLYNNADNSTKKWAFFTTTPSSSQSILDFRTWVEEKYTENKPLKLAYGRGESVEENITLPIIESVNGTTIIEVNTKVNPTKISAVHKI